MKQGVLVAHRVRLLLSAGMSCYRPRRRGERKRKTVRGCIVGPDLNVLNLVIVKKGEHGALLFCGDDVFAAPAYPLEEVIDPTGAGDSFLGGFAGHLCRTGGRDAETMRQAVVVGSALASFTVEAFGTDRLLEVTPEALDGRIAAFRRLSAVPHIVTA